MIGANGEKNANVTLSSKADIYSLGLTFLFAMGITACINIYLLLICLFKRICSQYKKKLLLL